MKLTFIIDCFAIAVQPEHGSHSELSPNGERSERSRTSEGTILPITEYTKEKFEKMMSEHPKFLIQF